MSKQNKADMEDEHLVSNRGARGGSEEQRPAAASTL